MTGFLVGIAVLIVLGQLGDLTGYDSEFSNKVLQAMLLDPVVDSVRVAERVLDEMMRAQAEYLPQFS
jgi:MFS superfamily sulfate permease-like transporter